MSDDTLPFPGSKWWKFDFHTHTPASNDYGRGNEFLKSIAPEEWLRNAMESGIDCVVVTDHNSGGWVDRLKATNNELENQEPKHDWFRPITIFPGVEITVANSSSRIHLLAVFDPSCDGRKITALLGSCGITDGFGDDQKTSTTTSFVETVKKIEAANGIAIPAHIDGAKGLLENITSLNPELTGSLNSVFAAEFCDLHKFDNAEISLKKEVGGLAQVAGSDAHKTDEIGRYFSWLKMSRPSLDGLHLALMDHEFCIKNQEENPNHHPEFFISTLTISKMHHCGRISNRPFFMQLHPHFNSVIGGRGTGKSTILESIRIVLRRDQDLATEAPRVKEELDKFMKLSQNKGVMLDNTEILLELHRRGKNYQLRWRFDGQGVVLEEESDNEWLTIETGDLKDFFPISIFSQKQINELASNPRGLLEIIGRDPEVNQIEWKSRWESVKSEFLQLRERQRELSRQLSNEPQIRAKLRDVENDLKQYEEKGHGEVLRNYQMRSQQSNSIPHSQIFDDLSVSIRELASTVGWPDFPANLFNDQDQTTAEIKFLHDQTTQDLKKISESLLRLAESVDLLKYQRNESLLSSAWYTAVKDSVSKYEELVREYEEKQSQLSISLYGEWVQLRNKLQQELNKLDYIRQERDETETQIANSIDTLLALRTELINKRRKFLDDVIGKSDYVRMELIQYGDVSTLEDDYRTLLNLNDGRFNSSICDRTGREGVIWEFSQWEDLNKSESELPQLVSTIKSRTLAIATGQDSGNHGAFDNRLKRLLETQPAIFDQLDAWWPEDMLRVKYSKDRSSNKFDDLEKGSAGQKAAAILAFLLSHGSEPLVMDQPEDDLDNALIYDLIVRQIHENKSRRQLVIVTHNPNIVVNGDSELVHVLKFEKNGQVQIAQQGGLEESTIREAICDIMEGGRQAFDKRYKRITLEI